MILGQQLIAVEPGLVLFAVVALAGAFGLSLAGLWRRLRTLEDRTQSDYRLLDRRITRLGEQRSETTAEPPVEPAPEPSETKADTPEPQLPTPRIPQPKERSAGRSKPTPTADTPAQPKFSAAASSTESEEGSGSTSGGMEERLGTKAFIWIGGIAIVLAGAFLVKYSFDNALLSPAVRVGIGAVFGVGMLVAGEFFRRRSARIASALTGAGVADLFGCLLAATSLYHLIGPTLGFALMAGVTAAAVGLALRHGRGVALLGLIGGFGTPPLIGGEDTATLPLLGYLALLQLGLTVVTRRRGWISLTGLTLLGSLVWAVVLAVTGLGAGERLAVEAFMIGSAGLYVLSATRFAAARSEPVTGQSLTPVGIAMSGLGAAVVLLGAFVWQGRFASMDFAMLGLMGAGVLGLARLRPGYGPMAWLAGAISAVVLLAWAVHAKIDAETLPPAWYGGVVGGFGLLYAGGAYAALWRSGREAVWAAGSAAAGAGFLVVAWFGLFSVTRPIGAPWWLLVGGVAGGYAIAAWPIWRRRDVMDQGGLVVGALAVASGGLAAFAILLGADYPWVMAGWAALAAGLAWLVGWQRIAGLRVVALVLGGLAVLGLIAPGPMAMGRHDWPVLNPLLPAYGLPAIGLGLAAWWLRGERDGRFGRVMRTFALSVGVLGVFVLIRHGFHPQNIDRGAVTLFEWATYAGASLVIAHGLLGWDAGQPGWPQRYVGVVGAILGGVGAIVGAGMLANPLLVDHAVGSWPVMNGLLYIYGLPGLGFALLGPRLRQYDDRLPSLTGATSLLMVFILVSLEVRQGFVGSVLSEAPVSMAEWYTYSVAWIGLGIVFVAGGIAFGSRSLRYASLAVMLLAIGKVFVLDTARLEDLYRVLSLFGLGLSLLGLGYVYQRYVFRSPGQVQIRSKRAAAETHTEGEG